MKRKILIAGLIIAATLPLFSCSSQTQVKDDIEAIRRQIKMESMIQ